MSDTNFNDFNRSIIDEFRANGGKVGGPFGGAPIVLLTHTGAKSGKQYTTPLVYLADGDKVLIFASKGGAPKHPDWYRNVVANPKVTVEIGTDRYDAVADVVTGAERDTLYAKQASIMSNFADYQKATTRVIPVVRLSRI